MPFRKLELGSEEAGKVGIVFLKLFAVSVYSVAQKRSAP